MSFRLSSDPEVEMPRVITSRSVLANPPTPGEGHRRAGAAALRARKSGTVSFLRGSAVRAASGMRPSPSGRRRT